MFSKKEKLCMEMLGEFFVQIVVCSDVLQENAKAQCDAKSALFGF